MDRMKKLLNEYLELFDGTLETLKKRKTPVLDERLLIVHRDNHIEYYTKKKDHASNEWKKRYLRKEDFWIARAIAQGDYEKELETKVAGIRELMTMLRDTYPDNGIEDVYLSIRPDRRALVDPVIPIRKQKLNEWMGKKGAEKGFLEGKPVFLTDNNEKVRSKSEMIIANLLYKEKIPYQYERQLILNNGREVYPDFSFYDPDNGEVTYWEHFGMMDNSDYQNNALKKINDYAADGIVAGVNLITSFENREEPLNIPLIKEIINQKLGHLKGWGSRKD